MARDGSLTAWVRLQNCFEGQVAYKMKTTVPKDYTIKSRPSVSTISSQVSTYFTYTCSRVPCRPPHGMAPLALAPGLGPSIRLCKTTSHPSSLYFLTIFNEAPANAIRFSTCNDPYPPSITPTHSHTGPQGGRGCATHNYLVFSYL